MAGLPHPLGRPGARATAARRKITFDLYAEGKRQPREVLTEASYAACLEAAAKLEGKAWTLIAADGETVTVVGEFDPDGIEEEGDPDEETPDPSEDE